jgi:hypothetical protein
MQNRLTHGVEVPYGTPVLPATRSLKLYRGELSRLGSFSSFYPVETPQLTAMGRSTTTLCNGKAYHAARMLAGQRQLRNREDNMMLTYCEVVEAKPIRVSDVAEIALSANLRAIHSFAHGHADTIQEGLPICWQLSVWVRGSYRA